MRAMFLWLFDLLFIFQHSTGIPVYFLAWTVFLNSGYGLNRYISYNSVGQPTWLGYLGLFRSQRDYSLPVCRDFRFSLTTSVLGRFFLLGYWQCLLLHPHFSIIVAQRYTISLSIFALPCGTISSTWMSCNSRGTGLLRVLFDSAWICTSCAFILISSLYYVLGLFYDYFESYLLTWQSWLAVP